MIGYLILLLHVLVSPFKTQARLEAEIVLLRHQLGVLRQRVPSRPKLTLADRLLFVWLYRLFPSVLDAVAIVQPKTVIRWHRKGFRLYWRWRSRRPPPLCGGLFPGPPHREESRRARDRYSPAGRCSEQACGRTRPRLHSVHQAAS